MIQVIIDSGRTAKAGEQEHVNHRAGTLTWESSFELEAHKGCSACPQGVAGDHQLVVLAI